MDLCQLISDFKWEPTQHICVDYSSTWKLAKINFIYHVTKS